MVLLIGYRQVVKESDWPPLESKASKIFKEKQPFERLHVSIADLKEMFEYSKYKMYYIENLLPPEGSSVYKCGTLVDLCLGPHIQNTGKIKAFQIMKVNNTPTKYRAPQILISTRIHHATFVAIRTTIPYSEYMALLFLTRRLWWSTRNFLKKPLKGIIAKSAWNKNYSSSTNYRQDQCFYCLMVR